MNSLETTTATTYEILESSITNPVTVEDYPWGFKLRTQQRYWIEYKPKMGFRFMTQTLDPRSNKWCKAKGSTYYAAAFMYRDAETGYIKWWASSLNGDDEINTFINLLKVNTTNFTEEQSQTIMAQILMSCRITARYLKDTEAYKTASAFLDMVALFKDKKNVSELTNVNFDIAAIKAIEKNY